MWAFALEAGFALFLLIFIVWWTMYSGRPEEGELDHPRAADESAKLPGQEDNPPH